MSREYIISVPDDAGFVEYSYIRGGRKYESHYAYRSMGHLVRCGECKHWCKGDEVYGICYRCPNTRQMRYDDFCSYGSRSEKPNNSERSSE